MGFFLYAVPRNLMVCTGRKLNVGLIRVQEKAASFIHLDSSALAWARSFRPASQGLLIKITSIEVWYVIDQILVHSRL